MGAQRAVGSPIYDYVGICHVSFNSLRVSSCGFPHKEECLSIS
jgi:hypothetical protein